MSTKSDARKYLEDLVGPLTMASLLLTLRECDEVSQTKFAKKLGISKQTLCDIEKSRKAVSPARAARFASKLGFPPELFIKIALQEELKNEGLRLTVTHIEVA